MESISPRASYYRDGRLVVSHYGADAIRSTNRQIATVDRVATARNPGAMPAPEVTDMVGVNDIHTQSFHSILVHRLDYRPQPTPAVGDVVVLSEPAYAACRADKLQLATPAYFRHQDSLKPGIRDRHDGTLTKDGTRWASSITGGSVSARLSFVSSGEPWVYCASHYRTDSELRRLRQRIRCEVRLLGGNPDRRSGRLRRMARRRLRPWLWTIPPTSRLVQSTRSATRAVATRPTYGMVPAPSTPLCTSTTARSTTKTSPAGSTGRNTGSIRTLLRGHGSPRKPRSRTKANTASQSPRLGSPCDRNTTLPCRRSCVRSPQLCELASEGWSHWLD